METRSPFAYFAVLLALFLASTCQVANAAEPKIGAALGVDPVFNGGQPLKVTLPNEKPNDAGIQYARDVAVLTSGRILLVNNDHVLAFNPDGSTALGFGVGGISNVDLSKRKLQGQSISGYQVDAVQSTADGGFVALGVATSLTRMFFPIVSKYDAAGQLDSGFGKGGHAILRHTGSGTTYDGSEQGSRLAISSTGEIVVATEEWLKPENGLTVSLLSSTGELRRTYGTSGVAGLGYRLNLGWQNEIGAVTFDRKGRVVLTGSIGDVKGCEDADPDLCTPGYEGQPVQFVARLDRQGNADRSFSGDGYAEPKKATVGCPTIGIKVATRGAIYMANQCGYIVRLSDSGKQVASFKGHSRFEYPPWDSRPVGDELLHTDSAGRISFAAWSKFDPGKALVSLVLQQVTPTGIDRTNASARNLSANKFKAPGGDLGRPFVLDYDSADNPVLASVRTEPGTDRPTVYLARFIR